MKQPPVKLPLYVIDAFTQTQFAGNQAAVVLLPHWLARRQMQAIASENNLSETAFVVNVEGVYHIRWFSPLKEIDFCGHATLASAFVIFSAQPQVTHITFWAKAVGDVRVSRAANSEIANGTSPLMTMRFPNRAPVALSQVPEALQQGLSAPSTNAEIRPIAYLRNPQAYFVVLANEEQVRQVVPNLSLLKTLAPFDVVVTARGREYDFVSRYFWPANGGEEDPVTGSIHAGLTPYWAEQLNKNTLVALQASRRSGELYCQLEDDFVLVSGYCVRYLEGEIYL